jgi:hypothetical protein
MTAHHRTFDARDSAAQRWGNALFCLVWLGGWGIGEFHAGKMLLRLLVSSAELTLATLPVFGFMLVWLTGWTVAGLLVLLAVGRGVAGRDDVSWTRDTVTVTRRLGPVRRARVVPRQAVRDVVHRQGRRVVLVTDLDDVECTDLGSAAQRDELCELLVRALDLAPERQAALPSGWSAWVDSSGRAHLRRAPSRVFAVLARVLGLAFCVAGVVGAAASGRPGGVALTLGLLGVVLLVLGAQGRRAHWVVAPGRCGVNPADASLALRALERVEVRREVDSDGDESFTVVLTGPDRTDTLLRSLGDEDTPRRLAHWLAARAQVPLLRVDA